MGQIVLNIEMPESAFHSLKIPKEKWPEFLRRTVAVALYNEGRISLGKAKEIAGFENKWEMIQLLNERGVALNYTPQNAVDDLETLNRILE